MKLDRWGAILVSVLLVDIALSTALASDEISDFDLAARRISAPAVAGFFAVVTAGVLIVGVLYALRSLRQTRVNLFRCLEELDATARTTDDWLWACDRTGVLRYSSPAVFDLLGYRPEEVVGRSMLDLLYDEQTRADVESELRASPPAHDTWEPREVVWRHRDGRAVWLAGAGVPLRDLDGAVVGYRGSRRPPTGTDADRAATGVVRARVLEVLSGGGVEMALQPIIDINRGTLMGAEALARFADGRGPDQWFRDAAQVGMTRQLDELTFLRALEVLDAMPRLPALSVNASPALLLDEGFREKLTRNPHLGRLIVEVTEHDRVGDYKELNQAVSGLRNEGVRFAIDDTGAGYSSLNHVLRLRPDIIKLDRDLVVDLDVDRARRALVTALVLLALEVGASVTGEGVETVEQLQVMRTLGVDHAQGFLIARPSLDPDDWEAWTHRTWNVADTVTAPITTKLS